MLIAHQLLVFVECNYLQLMCSLKGVNVEVGSDKEIKKVQHWIHW